MGVNQDNLIIYSVVFIIVIIVFIIVLRAVFPIPQILKHNRAMIKLLAQINVKSGASRESIEAILKDADEHFQSDKEIDNLLK